MDGDVMIAVDPHKASGTAAVLGPVTKTVIAAARFASSADGCGRLAGLARRREQRRWAVEGCRGVGRPLALRLVAGGEHVLEVPARLAARVRVYSPGPWPQDRPGRRHAGAAGRPGGQRRAGGDQ